MRMLLTNDKELSDTAGVGCFRSIIRVYLPTQTPAHTPAAAHTAIGYAIGYANGYANAKTYGRDRDG